MISDSIPSELNLDILSRLPAKSIARFHCVSKLWASILGGQDLKDLFLTKSSAKPRLLFGIEENDKWSIYSSPQHLSQYEKLSPSVVVTLEFHIKFPPEDMEIYSYTHGCPGAYASGLVYFYVDKEQWSYLGRRPMVCNPKTGRYEVLPYIRRYRKTYSFFGFDPIYKQFKVLLMRYPFGPGDHRIMTLGTMGMRWRKIKCSLRHECVSSGICINGVLYYLGDSSDCMNNSKQIKGFVIVCFDVRSEKFKFIYQESSCKLINYKGKLGLVYYDDKSDNAIKLRVWVLEDVEKQEWSKYAYTLKDDRLCLRDVFVVGVSSKGEMVLSMAKYTSKQPFYVFYFNPETNTLQRVEIQGFGEGHEYSDVYVFADHVDDLNANDSKLLKSSIYVPYIYREESEEEEKEEFDENGIWCFFGKRKKKKKMNLNLKKSMRIKMKMMMIKKKKI
ncbi:F-box protein [Raphanus sativus]|uniref:F-box protein At1g47340-like n=1 Tax=Raphanus sativus TaxID=3726 RepID=A0A6J0MXR4_RAPSA|nr:F-box protein At1g47340-like [Raphanus sativus]KAJ4917406.1 F-box protein [Raphanus sativus]